MEHPEEVRQRLRAGYVDELVLQERERDGSLVVAELLDELVQPLLGGYRASVSRESSQDEPYASGRSRARP
jgi:hypothetical protein